MEKKKLKKLTINKMSGFPAISDREQMEMKGGGWLDYSFEWALQDLGLSSGQIEAWFYDMSDAIGNAAYYGSNVLKNLGEAALCRILGGPISAPFIFLDSPVLYESYGISRYGTGENSYSL